MAILYGAYEIAAPSPSNSYPAGTIFGGMSQAVSRPPYAIRTFAPKSAETDVSAAPEARAARHQKDT